jgi:hypothetical protein
MSIVKPKPPEVCNLRIEMKQPGHGRVFLDDIEVKRVRAVKFEASVDNLNTVVLTLIPDVVEITGVASVQREYIALHRHSDTDGDT